MVPLSGGYRSGMTHASGPMPLVHRRPQRDAGDAGFERGRRQAVHVAEALIVLHGAALIAGLLIGLG
ncbi:unannotated protein [freshwater metagenome]|uniref:Unannotated protein n=1 Tax=freshwater metagenome TaxID=449393 RepID=A0A6J6ENF7_9ZZZZ